PAETGQGRRERPLLDPADPFPHGPTGALVVGEKLDPQDQRGIDRKLRLDLGRAGGPKPAGGCGDETLLLLPGRLEAGANLDGPAPASDRRSAGAGYTVRRAGRIS